MKNTLFIYSFYATGDKDGINPTILFNFLIINTTHTSVRAYEYVSLKHICVCNMPKNVCVLCVQSRKMNKVNTRKEIRNRT